jgi:hypothetical protein
MRKNIQTRKEFKAELERMSTYVDKGYQFKIDKTTEKKLDKTVAEFNSKIDRIREDIKKSSISENKKRGELAALPEKLNKRQLINTIQTKEMMVNLISDFREFLVDGAEELVKLPNTQNNLKMTKWQKEWAEKKLVFINEQRRKEREARDKIEVMYNGKKAGYTRDQIGMNKGDHDIRDRELYHYSDKYDDLRVRMNLILREMQPNYWDARAKVSREAYLEKLKNLTGDYPIGKKIYEYVKQLPLEHFKRVWESDNNLFGLLYDLEKIGPEGQSQIYKEIWDEWFTFEDENGNTVSYDMKEEFNYYIEHGEVWRDFYKKS